MLLSLLQQYQSKGAAAKFAMVLDQPSNLTVALATSRFSPQRKALNTLRRLKRRVFPPETLRGRIWRALRAWLAPKPAEQ